MDIGKQTRLESLRVGPLPIINAMLERLNVEKTLDKHLAESGKGRPRSLSTARALTVLLRNILVSRMPLYAIPQWLEGFVPEQIGVTEQERCYFNDDRIGRSLERLFDCDPTTLSTDLIVAAVRRFRLTLKQTHNDSTTVTFQGKYHPRTDTVSGKTPPEITYGFNKDHRPDLKQLVFELSVTADGFVPIHFKVHDGNITDDQTHRDTWSILRQLVGSSDFLYIADSKAAVSETMRFIDEQKGKFLSVLPRTRKECDEFFEYLDDHVVEWTEVRREDSTRGKQKEQTVYTAFEPPMTIREGFRIVWYKSSQKQRDDAERRADKLAAARLKIEVLEGRLNRIRQTNREQALDAANKLLTEMEVDALASVNIEPRVIEEFVQKGRGRPGPRTNFQMIPRTILTLTMVENAAAIAHAARFDGLFPLVTNSTLTAKQMLDVYKHQPFLEKRHQQMKSVLDVAPVLLKKPRRVAGLLFLYFVALLISALIEREARRAMRKAGIHSLPIYPEERLCKAPTAELVLDAFSELRRHRLLDAKGNCLATFFDQLPPAAKALLPLLDIDPSHFGIDT